MHRVLSYQTAMSAGNGRDVREYVTKRTCVSLILTIAFFTLISGFLLGKFVADRQYHIKYFRDTDLHVLKDLIVARNKLDQAIGDFIQHSTNNSRKEQSQSLYAQYTNCMNETLEYNLPLDVFVARYISHRISQQGTCFLDLEQFVRNNLEEKPPNEVEDEEEHIHTTQIATRMETAKMLP